MALVMEFSDDFAQVERFMGRLGKQLNFAISRAINNTAKDFQKFQRNSMDGRFTIRRRQFMNRSIKIERFARKNSLEARVSVRSPGGRDVIFGKFEVGGTKQAIDGGSVAVPAKARRGRSGVIAAKDKPRGFNWRRVGKIFKGDRRTFLIPGVGIYQRGGGRKGKARGRKRLASSIRTRRVRDAAVQMLWQFLPSVRIGKWLRFVSNARKVIPRVLPGHFHSAFLHAVRTARR